MSPSSLRQTLARQHLSFEIRQVFLTRITIVYGSQTVVLLLSGCIPNIENNTLLSDFRNTITWLSSLTVFWLWDACVVDTSFSVKLFFMICFTIDVFPTRPSPVNAPHGLYLLLTEQPYTW